MVGCPINIYMTDNIEALDHVAKEQRKKLAESQRPDMLANIAKRLLKELSIAKDDEEKAYILATRYLYVIELTTKVSDDKKFISIKYESEYKRIQKKQTELRESLTARYEALRLKKTEKPVIEFPVVPPLEHPYWDKNTPVFKSMLISPKEFYFVVNTPDNNILVIDTRPLADFQMTEWQIQNVINIPEDLITPGLSAHTLGLLLPDKIQEVWEKRDSYSALILIDWCTNAGSVETSKLDILRKSVVDWDPNRNYKQEPVILNGGLKELLDLYPSLVSNAHIYMARMNCELDELLEIDDVAYPIEQDSQKPSPIDKPSKDSDSVVLPEPSLSIPSLPSSQPSSRPPSPTFVPKNVELQLQNKQSQVNELNEQLSKEVDSSTKGLTNEKEQLEAEIKDLEAKIDTEIPDDKPLIPRRDRKPLKVTSIDKDQIAEALEEEYRKQLEKARLSKPSLIPNISFTIPGELKLLPTPPSVNRSVKPVETRKTKLVGLVGLKNIRNTCYMNTVLQCLRCLPEMRQLFLSRRFDRHVTTPEPQLIYQTRDVARDLWLEERQYIVPNEFYNKVCQLDPVYDKGNHEDCMEFFLFLINKLNEDCSKEMPKPEVMTVNEKERYKALQGKSSIFTDIFYHLIKHEKYCDDCDIVTPTFEIDNTLMLPVPEHECFLEALCHEYFSEFQINDYCCTKCRKMVRNKKVIVNVPKVLVIVLKRYNQMFSNGTAHLKKNDVKIHFPINNFKFGTAMYNLYAVSLHQGNLNAGHYTAGVQIQDKWYECDDDVLYNIDIKSESVKSMVTALFYSKV